MRRMTFASIWMQRDGHLCDVRAEEARFNDHLHGELHTGGLLVQALVQLFRESTVARVDVIYVRSKPPPRQEGEHWVAPPSMEKRHCAGQHGSAAIWKATTLHQLKAFPQL